MTDDPKIKHISWRNGRPRFAPSPSLRGLGFESKDLKHDNGRWMTAGEALDWSNAFCRKLEQERRKERIRSGGSRPARKTIIRQPTTIAPAYTVQQLFDDWLNLTRNPRMADRAEKTRVDYAQKSRVIQNYLPDVWESEAAALTKPICLGLYDTLRAKTSIRTAHGAMTILGIALQWAIDRGRLGDMMINPAHKLNMKAPPPRIRYATREEIRVLIETADAMGSHDMGDMFTLAVWSGQRQADRINLTFAGREKGRLIFRQAKTRVIVSIPEAEEITKRLDAARKRRTKAEIVSPYVIPNEETWKAFTGDRYRRRFEDIRKAAGKTLPSIKTLRDQDLRDTAVTWLATAGCTVPEICTITGHSFATAHDILKHYLALNPQMADSAIAKLTAWYIEDDKTTGI